MMILSEGHIHVAIRQFLKRDGWRLVAGQYPGGTDDELKILNVYDPSLATDNSPDPRRHSLGKQVPDLVAFRQGVLLIVEAKPRYDVYDRDKLVELLSSRRDHLLTSLEKFAIERGFPELLPVEGLTMRPVLAFSADDKEYVQDPGFVVLRVKSLQSVVMEGPF